MAAPPPAHEPGRFGKYLVGAIFLAPAVVLLLVWMVYPKLRRIHVYESADSCKILGINEVLDGGKVIPGFSLPLADLFNLLGVSA